MNMMDGLTQAYISGTLEMQDAVNTAVATRLGANKPLAAKTTGIGNCDFVNMTKPVAEPLVNNFVNLFKYWGPILVVILIIIGIFSSVTGRGGAWFKNAAIIVFFLLIIGGLVSLVKKVGGPVCAA